MYLGDGMGVVVESFCLFFLVSCIFYSFILCALLSSNLSHSLSFLLMELHSFLLLVLSFLCFCSVLFCSMLVSLLCVCLSSQKICNIIITTKRNIEKSLMVDRIDGVNAETTE